MEFSKLVDASAVRSSGKLPGKKRLFLMLGEIAQSCYGLCREDTVDALLERENLGSTAVGNGVALPHARIEGLDRVVAAFVRLEKPLDFDAADRKGVDLVFALFAPANAGAEHLKSLALASRTFRNPDICDKLRSNDNPSTLHAILTEGPMSNAA